MAMAGAEREHRLRKLLCRALLQRSGWPVVRLVLAGEPGAAIDTPEVRAALLDADSYEVASRLLHREERLSAASFAGDVAVGAAPIPRRRERAWRAVVEAMSPEHVAALPISFVAGSLLAVARRGTCWPLFTALAVRVRDPCAREAVVRHIAREGPRDLLVMEEDDEDDPDLRQRATALGRLAALGAGYEGPARRARGLILMRLGLLERALRRDG